MTTLTQEDRARMAARFQATERQAKARRAAQGEKKPCGCGGKARKALAPASTRPHIAVMVNSCNEGLRLQATCRMFHDHLVALKVPHEIIVCDDGTPGGPGELPDYVSLVRHTEQLGCARSKLDATALATAQVLMWVDAHQAPKRGDMTDLIEMALAERAVICPITSNMAYNAEWELEDYGRAWFVPWDLGMFPSPGRQYRTFGKDGPGTIHMVSVGLAMSRETYEALGGWNNYASTHGSQERGMGLRAFMAEIPVKLCESVSIGHEFVGRNSPSRNRSPWKSTVGHYNYNGSVWHAFTAVAAPETITDYFLPLLPGQGPAGPQALADRLHFARYCKRRPDQDLIDFMETLREEDRIWTEKKEAADKAKLEKEQAEKAAAK